MSKNWEEKTLLETRIKQDKEKETIIVSVSEPEQDKKYSFEELNKKIEYDDIKGSKIEINGIKMSYIGLLREARILSFSW